MAPLRIAARTSVAVVLVVVMLAMAAGPVPDGAGASVMPNVAPDNTVTWLDIGDSYASGEGSTGASGLCQQSDHAFGPRAALLRDQRQWRIDESPRTACTSHRAIDLFNSPDQLLAVGLEPPPNRSPGADPAMDISLSNWRSTQSEREKFDVVTMSFGGNDIHFADLLLGCILGVPTYNEDWDGFFEPAIELSSCLGLQPELEQLVQSFTTKPIPAVLGDGQAGTLVDFYRSVASTMVSPDGVLVVVGYPRLFTPSRTWGRWRGGQCNGVEAAEADMLGMLSEQLDRSMRTAVSEADGGSGRIRYVSRLELFDAGGGKSLCAPGVEWLNTIFLFLRDGSLRYQRGFHPNDLGNEATAERVAGEIDAQIGQPPPTTTTTEAATPSTEPRVDSDRSTFDVGEDFDERCTLAWPFAPSHGSLSTQFRTTCPGVPSQFLFVDVVYPGDLDLSSSRPQVRVRGRINDVQKSEMGFTVLVVEADEVKVE